ncbi:alpha/beta fold hydrolase [Novosphingobium sp. FSY-8]|uniref:Alpha/beta fold hydrolase n=1 Tax=Novosphingobium ovatum TaxID=1908523 RepID=A0ABW9XBU9_9SPHN|nr:alpha/beta fold hydrolase [Novosphingobium ovatum]NBC35998.1 alpha/beta fold hydrolase [Novosphingobium ovatum]
MTQINPDAKPAAPTTAPSPPEPFVERAFVRLSEGQMHLRILPAASPDTTDLPLVICHASPASSWFSQGLMRAIRAAGHTGAIIAPDTLGNGDSCAPAGDHPDIAYFADSVARMLDGLGFDRVHIYGTHTGARIACEFAALFPARTGKVILDGITEYPDDLRQQVIANYAPVVEPDQYGRHLIWAFNFCRDQALFFPHFMQVPDRRLAVPMPPPQVLHRITLDVLKAMDTYSKPYIAAFEYAAFDRMAHVAAPTLLLKPENELALLNASVARALEILADGQEATVPAGDAAKAAVITAFLTGAAA